MEVALTISRKFLHGGRPDYFYFMTYTVFPRTEGNVNYPDSGPPISILRDLYKKYAAAYGAKNTTLADEIYEEILNATVVLIIYVEGACGNVLSTLEETGFKANPTKGTPNPVTGKVLNVFSMALGEGKMKFEYKGDEYAHDFSARIRLKGGTDADWVNNGKSQTQTMYISGLLHGKDYKIQICGNGTKGEGDWSDIKGFLVD